MIVQRALLNASANLLRLGGIVRNYFLLSDILCIFYTTYSFEELLIISHDDCMNVESVYNVVSDEVRDS